MGEDFKTCFCLALDKHFQKKKDSVAMLAQVDCMELDIDGDEPSNAIEIDGDVAERRRPRKRPCEIADLPRPTTLQIAVLGESGTRALGRHLASGERRDIWELRLDRHKQYLLGFLLCHAEVAREAELPEVDAAMLREARKSCSQKPLAFVVYTLREAMVARHEMLVDVPWERFQCGLLRLQFDRRTEEGEVRCTFEDTALDWDVHTPGGMMEVKTMHAAFGEKLLNTEVNTVFHLVGVPPGAGRYSHRCLNDFPSRPQIEAFMDQDCVEPVGAHHDLPDLHEKYVREYPVEQLLEWLRATKTLRSLHDVGEAQSAWAAIFERHTECSVDSASLRRPSYFVLRQLRVRFDIMMMLAFKYHFHENPDADEDFFIWIDASPQWRGKEMLAASWDTVQHSTDGPPKITRRMFPALAIGAHLRDLRGKLYAFLWMVGLQVGFTFSSMVRFLSKVRGLVTDLGTEHLIRDADGRILIEFLLAQGVPTPPQDECPRFLLPRALLCPGWHHMVDGLVRHGLCHLRWFPRFLSYVKALVRFVRDYKEDLTALLISQGMCGLASAIRATKTPIFTSWRWNRLYEVTESLTGILDSLRLQADKLQALLAKSRDRKWMATVKAALACDAFVNEFLFVHWHVSWLHKLEQWCMTCLCPEHQEWRRRGEEVKCPMQGRVLPQAWSKVVSSTADALAHLENWSVADFGGDLSLMSDCQATVRATCGRAKLKFGYLCKIPYALVNFEDDAVRRDCLDQLRSAPECEHDRISVMFLSEGGPLRQYVDQLERGDGMHPILCRELLTLQFAPWDDTPAEAPHARVHQIEARGRAAHWPWQAACLRLDQNFKDNAEVCPRCSPTRQEMWDNHKCILDMKSAEKCVKMAYPQFVRKVYQLYTDNHPFRAGICGVELAVDDEMPPDEDDEHVAADADARPRKAPRDRDTRLMKEWLEHCLEKYNYVSIFDGLGEAHHVFQVLEFDRNLKTVKSFDEAPITGLPWLIQHYEVWANPLFPEDTHQIFVFSFGDAEVMDILRWSGSALSNRTKFRAWQRCESDLEGTHCLESPTQPVPTASLTSSQIPIIILLDELEAKGCVARPGKVIHSRRTRIFDSRNTRRPYLQAVLAKDWLFAQGAIDFPPDRTNSFYEMLMRAPEEVAALLAADREVLEKRLVDHIKAHGEVNVPGISGRRPLAPADLPAREVNGDDGQDLAPCAVVADAPAGDDPVPGHEVDGDVMADNLPTHIDGTKLKYEEHVGPNGLLGGYRVACPTHGWPCRRFRSLLLDTHLYGSHACVYWLRAWMRAGPGLSVADHKSHMPSPADIEACIV